LALVDLGNGLAVELIESGAEPPVPVTLSTGSGEQTLGTASGLKIMRIDGGTTQPLLAISSEGSFYVDDGVAALPAAIYSIDGQLQERPRFSALRTIADGRDRVSIEAVLDCPSFSGTIVLALDPSAPSGTTLVDASLVLKFGCATESIAIAPAETMFLFNASNRGNFDDYRPAVHDSEGLWMLAGDGQTSWRSLNNPPLTANSYFSNADLASFGLVQRSRHFATYQDAEAHFELRPSLFVEPSENWGNGFVRLIEQPSRSERQRNVLAFWMPRQNYKAGETAEFRYRLRWDPTPASSKLAMVARFSAGRGGVSGVANSKSLRKFVVDFAGPTLSDVQLPSGPVDAFVSLSHGSVEHVAVSRIARPDTFRLAFDATIDTADPVELRAYLIAGGRQLTETWLYQWRTPLT